ncbi:hypothetical protein GOODEAATRI_018609 [Goodea atripinnis]|uniref:BIRC2/3-like UBA domain-containing protein n=1 Tax=Goodea atripinnis TaxID=208336 RepID=A0ABV0N5R6_9TELE
MSHQRPTCHNPSMRREQDRLESFHSWTLSIITPTELARAGFYYLGQGDRVACFSCGGQVGIYEELRTSLMLNNWEPGDRAVSEHQRHYPNCRFVRGDRADNVSLAGAAATVSLATTSQVPAGAPGLTSVSNPSMQQSDERLLTFVNWPSRIPVRPEQLAKAGFYYVEMGFDRSLVKQTVQSKILTSGENYRTVQELVLDLLSAEDQKREEEREMLAEAMASGACCENIMARCAASMLLNRNLFSTFFCFRWFHVCEEAPGSIVPAPEEC